MERNDSNKWVEQITRLQRPEGNWGFFHTLSKPTSAQPMTTEQALRRLRVLGLTAKDPPIHRALMYMRDCLGGKQTLPDRREKAIHWDAFEALMLAAWIRIFEPEDSLALSVAWEWADMVTVAFVNGGFEEAQYAVEYRRRFPKLHRGERLIGLSQFYMVHLLKGLLDRETERRFMAYMVQYPQGIYYVYDQPIARVPGEFQSLQASRWLAALEQLVGYSCAGDQLAFGVEWLKAQQDQNGQWDMGTSVKDGIYFPLSNSWRKASDRVQDCTIRISRLVAQLSGG